MTARATRAMHTTEGQSVIFRCPACDENHRVTVGPWSWNGSLDLPTFSPSVLVGGVQWAEGEPFHKAEHAAVPAGGAIVCHSFVTDGRIQYLGDCTHALAGQTVDLPAWRP